MTVCVCVAGLRGSVCVCVLFNDCVCMCARVLVNSECCRVYTCIWVCNACVFSCVCVGCCALWRDVLVNVWVVCVCVAWCVYFDPNLSVCVCAVLMAQK